MSEVIRSSMSSIPADRWDLAFSKDKKTESNSQEKSEAVEEYTGDC